MIEFPQVYSLVSSLYCPVCDKEYDNTVIQTFARCCNQPLLTRYDTSQSILKETLLSKEQSMWRYFEMLPVYEPTNIVTLGEGMTPLLQVDKLGARFGMTDVFIKNESANPTGSFKARGMSVAVSRLKELGVKKCILPTAGNAGGALAAYCAKAGIRCKIVMPRFTPVINKRECTYYGAEVVEINGMINDCAVKVKEINHDNSYFDLSTMKEPYRLEGKKTMAYEIAEQLHWEFPDVIVYPAGGGTGLIGMWKAFNEMKALEWVTGQPPKMIAVQSEVCAPLVRARNDYKNWKKDYNPQPSIAFGITVPYPFALDLMLNVVNDSDGIAVTVTENDIQRHIISTAKQEGIFLSPEGAATVAAIPILKAKGIINTRDKIVLMNTGSGYKYL